MFAFLSYNIVFAIWHTPAYYEATLRSVPIHVLEHALFFSTAALTCATRAVRCCAAYSSAAGVARR